MRTTVGPLPPAVYWRRRAVVLGAVLLGVIVLFVNCSGSDQGGKQANAAGSQAPTPAPATTTPSDQPSFADAEPGDGPSLPDPSDLTTPPAAPPSAAAGNVPVTAAAGGPCTDAEVVVVAAPAATTIKRGASIEIKLKIKNVSARTCARPVGSDAQELYIDQGAQKVWSSDTCSTTNQPEVKSLTPGTILDYRVTWNGRMATKCEAGQAVGPAPNPGQYEVHARLGTKIGPPVVLTIVA
ncbi:adhesin [Krasilnikovia sp. MM14-A1259]|uniref:adhesin n=1 Tax=Krasilnikovia sp. MM14-A1259 TaxID=3373539 RepID=UPI00399C6889